MGQESAVKLANVDLNLLVALELLLAERNVTRAGERLRLSQPAMSGTLARLRRLFDDPLVVRRGNVTSLTPFAESLIEPVHEILVAIDRTLRERPTFDPAADSRTFAVVASDYLATVLLPPLLQALEKTSPNVRVTVEPIDPRYTQRILGDDVDLLIMPRQSAEKAVTDLPSQSLFTEEYVCVVWRGNPDVGERITVEQLAGMPYLAFRAGSSGLSYADEQLAELGIVPRIEVATSSFAAVPFLMTGTRLVAMMHRRFAERIADPAEIRLLEPPVPVLPIVEAMFWHPRRAFDPAHRWLRGLIAAVAGKV